MHTTAVTTISREDLKTALDRGDPVVIVEALPEPFYRKAHLPGAINIPPDRLDELAPTLLPNKDARIVVYCSDLACQNSAIMVRLLTELGYQNVWDYAEGKQDWIAAGLPVESGRSTDAAEKAPAVACSLDEAALATRSEELRRDLFALAEETRELADGYTFRFPVRDGLTAKLLDFIEAERHCCSFFRIELVFEPQLGPLWLRLTGPEGTKSFIRGLLGPDRSA